MTSIDIEASLLQLADKKQARNLQRFFKTGTGEYADGDRFLGIKNPQVRDVVKASLRTTTLEEAVKLVKSPWHEVRLCGLLIMVAQYEKAARSNDEALMHRLFDTYLSLHEHINNWDLVDLSAIKIAGHYELTHSDITVLDEWIYPDHTLWQRRISMVSTWWSIKYHNYDRAVQRAEILLKSDHDLLHKAAGWMLREIYKRSDDGKTLLVSFLKEHITNMPSIMLSYATEKMSPQERHCWQQRRKDAK